MFVSKCLKCGLIVMLCGLLLGCQATKDRIADMTPTELSEFMIACGMAGAKGHLRLGANGELGFGVKHEAYTRSPGSRFEFDCEMDPGNVTPDRMKQYIEAQRLLRKENQPETKTGVEATERSNENDEESDAAVAESAAE